MLFLVRPRPVTLSTKGPSNLCQVLRRTLLTYFWSPGKVGVPGSLLIHLARGSELVSGKVIIFLQMLTVSLLVIGGLILLAVGAESLVRGSTSIALRLGITPLVIGL